MRIDLVITELFVGGAERCLTELALGLSRCGDRVRVASIAPLPTGEQAALVEQLLAAGIPVHTTDSARSYQAMGAYRSLRRWLAEDRPDVVQTMLYHANVLGTPAARSLGVKGCVGAIRVAEHKPLRLWIERRAVARMDALACVSESVQRFATQAFAAVLPPCTVIGNAIDMAKIDALPAVRWEAFGWPEDAEVLLYVGRLHPQKGLDVLAAALEPLLASHPELRCLIVGEGPLRPMIQHVADRWGAGRLQIAGWRRDALAIIKASRLVVLPSRYEGMPNVILEAMAAGKPVAACRVEGVAELLGEAVDDQSCPPEDPAALRRLIDRLWDDRQGAPSRGRKNRQRAEARFDLDAMAAAYREIYRSLILDQRAGKP